MSRIFLMSENTQHETFNYYTEYTYHPTRYYYDLPSQPPKMLRLSTFIKRLGKYI